MNVVSNSTPLISLALIERFDLLFDLFGEINIAQAVYDETVTRGREIGSAKKEVSSAAWVRVREIKDRLAVEILLEDLDLGEAETIVLAREISADIVLMDERKGRRKLDQLGLPKVGTVGILLRAKGEGLIESLRAELEKLQRTSFRLDPSILEEALRQVGEL